VKNRIVKPPPPVITEISYYFDSRERDGELEWVVAVLEDFLGRLTSFRNKS
jgi:hypothetical protein